VLVQLPPSLAFDAATAGRFFAMLRRRHDGRVACEPRHASWFTPAAQALLERHRIARVAADPALLPSAAVPGGAATAGWRYWRWHGSPRMYYSGYGDAALRALADVLLHQASARAPAWCIFDNTAHGHAMDDAARLQEYMAFGEVRQPGLTGSSRRPA
jgi:uncharacterized protein YecE (DUF72 family)